MQNPLPRNETRPCVCADPAMSSVNMICFSNASNHKDCRYLKYRRENLACARAGSNKLGIQIMIIRTRILLEPR
jgi:hypothetical protein